MSGRRKTKDVNKLTKTRIKNFFTKLTPSKTAALVVGLLVVGSGIFLLVSSAAGFFAATDPESATVSGNAKVVNDTSATGGKAVEFTAPTGTTPPPTDPPPTPPPPPSATCSSTPNVPGGTDPWGGCWPGEDNTGVPAGTVLGSYSSPCTITTANTIIDSKNVTCDELRIKASNVIIRKSKLKTVYSEEGTAGSVTIEDSEADSGMNEIGTIRGDKLTVIRSDIRGGQHSVHCFTGSSCKVQDSWLHAQRLPSNDDWHNNALISNGGSGIRATHNTLHCEPNDNGVGGGCTADLSLLGDFAAITDVLVDKNLFMATPGGYCTQAGYHPQKTYGTQGRDIRYTNNIFKRGSNNKCGFYGTVTSFNSSSPGNVWTNNKYEDGATVNP